MGRRGSSSVAFLVSHHRSLGYAERRCGFNTKHRSTKGKAKGNWLVRGCAPPFALFSARALSPISGRGAARAEDAQGTPAQIHISPSIQYEENDPLGPSGFKCSQHSPTTRPSVERTAERAYLPSDDDALTGKIRQKMRVFCPLKCRGGWRNSAETFSVKELALLSRTFSMKEHA